LLTHCVTGCIATAAVATDCLCLLALCTQERQQLLIATVAAAAAAKIVLLAVFTKERQK
jgi:hypothetical protein